MHELSYMVQFANMALEAAKKNNARKVSEVKIRVGQMTGLVPEYLQHYYPQAAEGTILEGSRLVIEERPVRMQCTCGNVYTPDRDNGYACPKCGSASGKLISGREMDLVSVEIEE
ncbi:MAG: hydrogenase maturation nickel metallochaperone HypA [Lachnospiraceae bacterium]|nr:hydrogenase maturation nickel metallochaperone HypA [Lachnospiraceae bacterium]